MKLDVKKIILKRKELDKTHKLRKARGKARLKKLLKK